MYPPFRIPFVILEYVRASDIQAHPLLHKEALSNHEFQ